MKVTVEFYKVHFDVANQMNISTSGLKVEDCINKYSNHFYNKVKELYDKKLDYRNNDNFIEILLVDEDTIFGIIGKTDLVEQGPMKRIKDSAGQTVFQTDLQIENYRFFLYDLKSHVCAVMNNKPAPAFKALFTGFLNFYNNGYVKSIITVAILDPELKDKYNRSKQLLKLSMAFDDTSSMIEQVPSLKDAFGISKNDIRRMDIMVDLKNSPKTDEISRLIEGENFIESNFSKFRITTLDDDNVEETLEFVRKLLIKTIELDVDESTIINDKYFHEIKQALMKSLF